MRLLRYVSSSRKRGLPCLLLLGLLTLALPSCGSDDCIEAVRLRDTNTHSDPCKVDCDCNNLTHEGYCVEGRCVSKKRETAQTKGAVRHCLLFRPRNLCRWGLQTAQPNPLTSLLWGDCRPYGIEPENTQATCTDGKDNNCDGRVDLFDPFCSAFCSPGQERPCFSGPQDRLNQGSCRPGRQTCLTPSSWGPCQGEVLPTAETCNGQDDDCNGSIDDGLPGCTPKPCKDGSQRPCYTHAQGCSLQTSAGEPSFLCVGNCRPGRQICQGGHWEICQGQTPPQTEVCDGLDNNCDGKVDEGCLCESSTRQACYPQGFVAASSPCRPGSQLCTDTFWGACDGAILPKPEICNGQDDDCNGLIDDNLQSPPCSKEQGVCTSSRKRCGGNSGWLECSEEDYRNASGQTYLADEKGSPCDGLDNDCNGQIDEDCQGCEPLTSRPCYNGPPKTASQGVCREGFQICQAFVWSACLAQILPTPELCDGKDNDCDGSIDNPPPQGSLCGSNLLCLQGSCVSPASEPSGTSDGGEAIPEAPPLCPTPSRPCYPFDPATEGIGLCRPGVQLCTLDAQGKEHWQAECIGAIKPASELCDGKDNDCNGKIDDQPFDCPAGWSCSNASCLPPDASAPTEPSGSLKPCYTGPPATDGRGECRQGIQHCDPSGLCYACLFQTLPASELCDGKDNDCNGLIDDGPALCPQGSCLQGRCSSFEASPEVIPDAPPSCQSGQQRTCFSGPTSSLRSPCQAGTQTCTQGRWGLCLGEIAPASEVCDGKDNDCDGQIDEGCSWALYSLPKTSTTSPSLRSIALRSPEQLWLGGSFLNDLDLLPSSVSPSSLRSSYTSFQPSASKALLLLFNSTGQRLCLHEPTSSLSSSFLSLEAANDGLIAVGSFYDKISLGGLLFSNASGASSREGDLFFAKYSPTCSVQWATRAGSSLDDGISSTTLTPDGSTFCSTGFSSSAYHSANSAMSFGHLPSQTLFLYPSEQRRFLACQNASTGTFASVEALGSYPRPLQGQEPSPVFVHAPDNDTLHLFGNNCSLLTLASLPSIPVSGPFLATYRLDPATRKLTPLAALATAPTSFQCSDFVPRAFASVKTPSGSNYLYAAGDLRGEIKEHPSFPGGLASNTFAPQNNRDGLLLAWEYKPSLRTYTFLWGRRLLSTDSSGTPQASARTSIQALRLDSQGNLFLLGSFQQGHLALASGTSITRLASVCIPSTGETQGCVTSATSQSFLLKLTPSAQPLWGLSGGGTSNSFPVSLAADLSGGFLYPLLSYDDPFSSASFSRHPLTPASPLSPSFRPFLFLQLKP